MKEKISRFDFEMAPLSCQDKGHRTELKLIITTKYKNLDEKLNFFKVFWILLWMEKGNLWQIFLILSCVDSCRFLEYMSKKNWNVSI